MFHSWLPGFGSNKAEEVKILAAKPASIVDIPCFKMLKRKRPDKDDSLETRVAPKRQKESAVSKPASGQSPADAAADQTAADGRRFGAAAAPRRSMQVQAREFLARADPNDVREKIVTQINLDILLKHNELRLIQQELAKCQIALEQIRRCREIPYPAMSGDPHNMVNVMTGTGPSVPKPGLDRQPESPAPRGVTDGPYTRHYARWLLSDPKFDGVSAHEEAVSPTAAGKLPLKGRTTRGSFNDTNSPVTTKSRSQRGSKSQLQALPSGYPVPKDKAEAIILRRAKDNQYVKLVCPGKNCGREDFQSAQGFINHCRISHHLNFPSHEQAAIECGVPVKVGEGGLPVPAISSFPQANATGSSLIHPLIRTAHLLKDSDRSPANMIFHFKERETLMKNVDAEASETAESLPNPSFVPSDEHPHLSDRVRRSGRGIDLKSLVAEITSPLPLDDITEEDDDDAESVADSNDIGGDEDMLGKSSSKIKKPFATSGRRPPPGTGRLPSRTTTSNHGRTSRTTRTASRPSSSKGRSKKGNVSTNHVKQSGQYASQTYSSPCTSSPSYLQSFSQNQMSDSAASDTATFSPQSHNDSIAAAPSLTSDDDDSVGSDESDEDDKEMEERTPSSVSLEASTDGEQRGAGYDNMARRAFQGSSRGAEEAEQKKGGNENTNVTNQESKGQRRTSTGERAIGTMEKRTSKSGNLADKTASSRKI